MRMRMEVTGGMRRMDACSDDRVCVRWLVCLFVCFFFCFVCFWYNFGLLVVLFLIIPDTVVVVNFSFLFLVI